MKGRNVFSDVIGPGEMLSESLASSKIKIGSIINKKTPCIFLSHKGEDKPAVLEIGEYIMRAGINIYLDIDDVGLQIAVARSNDVAITKFIELGITNSTHLMAVISEKTKNSWWVSYEIGFGKRNRNKLATLKLKDVTDLPSFLKITHEISGIVGLNGYLNTLTKDILEETDLLSYCWNNSDGKVVLASKVLKHPLKDYLKTSR